MEKIKAKLILKPYEKHLIKGGKMKAFVLIKKLKSNAFVQISEINFFFCGARGGALNFTL